MMTRGAKQTEIWSIYGQIESVVAQAMVDEGKFNKIEFEMMPPEQQFNEAGDRALFAVTVPAYRVQEYERRVAALRA